MFLSLSQMQKSRCAYVPCLTAFLSAVGLQLLLKTDLRVFHCRKGIIMLEYKYNIGAACNTIFQKQSVFKELAALGSLETK